MFTHRIHERLELKPLHDRHAKELFALVERNREHLKTYMNWLDKTQSDKDTLAFIKTMHKDAIETGSICCTIWYDGILCGIVDLHRIDTANKKTSIGYWMSHDHTGKGIMTQSVAALLDYAFGELALNHVFIKAATCNAASRAIPERLGFTHEGTLRDDIKMKDRYLDHEVYGMRAEEWKTRGLADGARILKGKP